MRRELNSKCCKKITRLKLHVDTFFGDLQLAALGDLDSLDGLVARLGGDVLDLLNDVIALKDLAENDVAAIEPTNQNTTVSGPGYK